MATTNIKDMTDEQKMKLSVELSAQINNSHFKNSQQRKDAVRLLNLLGKYPSKQEEEKPLPDQFEL